ncbi:MAG: type 2 isopentenyl-diphosphate Delta-isomerase [Candidatus Binatia bacterium]
MPTKRRKALTATQRRKKEHLELCLDTPSVSSPFPTGFDNYSFIHNALPEIDLDEVDLATAFLGKPVKAPILISSMTGGFDLAAKVNRNLALAAQRLGLAMGVGSQRVALESPNAAPSFKIREIAPDVVLLANLGAVQLNYGYTIDHCRRAVEMIRADALILHLNPLQEAAQPEGNRNFKDLAKKIAEVCRRLEVPVVVKEVGGGISGEVALRLKRAGVKAIDVAGAGGTSWYAVEARRAAKKGQAPDFTFSNWGIPTDEALRMARGAVPDLEIVASGGIRNGLDIAKAIALGADLCAIAQPLLAPALESADQVIKSLLGIIRELKIAMFCVGAGDLSSLRKVSLARRSPGWRLE